MTVEEAKKILSKNRIDLSSSGFEALTIDPMVIGSIRIGHEDDDWRDILAVTHYSGCKGKTIVMSYFVQIVGFEYIHCDFFNEVLEIIEALKVVPNEKKHERDRA